MRVLYCPSAICLCKPSSDIYTAGPLKLEQSPCVPSTTVASLVDGQIDEAAKEERVDKEVKETQLKSSLRKANPESKQVGKKRVQWGDYLGKELVEMREFESSEFEDAIYEAYENRSCFCVIL